MIEEEEKKASKQERKINILIRMRDKWIDDVMKGIDSYPATAFSTVS